VRPCTCEKKRASSGAQERQVADLRQPVGHELLAEVELAAADDVAVDVPADALAGFDALGIAFGGRRATRRRGFEDSGFHVKLLDG
jgi:hypothetical protein